ncbi:thioredoxin family protein [Bacillus fonticola]|uniref:thioredoxin family protein n=1 Tax=Bacillus fonticola TaxID=2728853 RepID=UPI00147351C9|nr:thioredoxin family protein [Bacillus fonticola]
MDALTSLEEFQQRKEMETTQLFMFTADWCPDCRVIAPFLPELEEATKGSIKWVSVDRDEFIDLCGELGVFGIPSFVAYRNGEELGRFVSKDRKTREEIENFISKL